MRFIRAVCRCHGPSGRVPMLRVLIHQLATDGVKSFGGRDAVRGRSLEARGERRDGVADTGGSGLDQPSTLML